MSRCKILFVETELSSLALNALLKGTNALLELCRLLALKALFSAK